NSSQRLAYGLVLFPSKGCLIYRAPWPNGQIVDHSIKTTAHEIIEAATNPFGDGWYLVGGSGELGDLCHGTSGPRDGSGSDLQLSGHKYLVQKLWNNVISDCAMVGSTTAAMYHVFPQFADGRFPDGSYYRSTLMLTNSNFNNSVNCTFQL